MVRARFGLTFIPRGLLLRCGVHKVLLSRGGRRAISRTILLKSKSSSQRSFVVARSMRYFDVAC